MNRAPRQVLIIKTGFSEFLDKGISTTVSLGDVLLCTSLLHLYKNDRVTWVTSWAARELLQNNPLIHELVIFGPEAFKNLVKNTYDILVNLEKDIGLCTYLTQVAAKKRCGFYFDRRRHDIATHRRATEYLLSGQENHNNIHKTAVEILYETVGEKWSGEGLILNRKRPVKEKFDVGFNYAVGSKWPTKAWPMAHWKTLENLLDGKFSVIWQKGHKNLQKYVDWIDGCRLIVTSDSLGQAIGQALGKKVITLYGPTNYRRMEGMPDTHVVPSSLKCPFMPCFLPFCKNKEFCMEHIQPREIAALCGRLLS